MRTRHSKKVLAATAAFVLVGLGLYLLVTVVLGDGGVSDRQVPTNSAGDAASRSAVSGTEGSGAALRVEAPPGDALTGPASEDPVDSSDRPEDIEISGRCVRETGEPVPAAKVEAILVVEPAPGTRGPADASSGTAGQFLLAREVDGDHDVRVRIAAEGLVPVGAVLRRPLPGESFDLGEVVLRPAVRVDGVVIDDQGVPVEGVRVLFVRIDLTSPPVGSSVSRAEPETMLTAFSDAQGRFAFDAAAWPGEWFIGAEYTGALIEPRNVQLGEELSSYELRVVVERPDPSQSIRGRVVDDFGQPVAGARLMFSGQGFIGRGISGVDGEFDVARAGPSPDRGRTTMYGSVDHPSGQFDWADAETLKDLDWGDEGVEIVLARRASRSVVVVDERGVAVEDYDLFAFAEQGRGSFAHLSRVRARGHHESGRSNLVGLETGRHGVLVAPRDPQLAPSALTVFEVSAATVGVETKVVCPDPVDVEVLVRSGAGTPIRGSQVELLLPLSEEAPTTTSRAVALSDCDRARGAFRLVAVAAGTTGEDGVTRFRAPPGEWTVRTRGEGHVDRLDTRWISADSPSAEIVVEVGASVTGRISPAAVVERLRDIDGGAVLRVVLEPVRVGEDEDAQLDEEVVQLEVSPDGGFQASGLREGDYLPRFELEYVSSEVQRSTNSWPMPPVTLGSGGPTELVFDATEAVPARIRGAVFVEGRPLQNVHCFLRRTVDPDVPPMIRVGTDDQGRFEALVRPGTYGFAITLAVQPGPGWILLPLLDRSVSLAPGASDEIEFRVELRRVELRLVDQNGAALASERVRLVQDGFHTPTRFLSDAEGRVEIDPAPLGPFRVVVGLGEDALRLGPFDLPIGARDGVVEVRVVR